MADGTEGFLAGLAGVQRGRFTGFGPDGLPRVETEAGLVTAQSLVALSPHHAGLSAAWVCLQDGTALVLGIIQPPARVVESDGENTVIASETELKLRCGKASITLTPDGRVVIRGTQILSRSEGANRVQGAVVLLN
ncbi:MAG: hypothetical protein HC844_16055 [Tabrizicola sp.]|nr:hypothetical protein [Tabrizicola sp.]